MLWIPPESDVLLKLVVSHEGREQASSACPGNLARGDSFTPGSYPKSTPVHKTTAGEPRKPLWTRHAGASGAARKEPSKREQLLGLGFPEPPIPYVIVRDADLEYDAGDCHA